MVWTCDVSFALVVEVLEWVNSFMEFYVEGVPAEDYMSKLDSVLEGIIRVNWLCSHT